MIWNDDKGLVEDVKEQVLKYLDQFYVENEPELQIAAWYFWAVKSVEFPVEGLESIPCKLVPKDSQKPFINLVDQILATKKRNPEAHTSASEKEIDGIVYELYGLTEEEICGGEQMNTMTTAAISATATLTMKLCTLRYAECVL